MLVVRLMADRYDLPKAERIVQKNQTISPVENAFSFILVRLNFAWLLLALGGMVAEPPLPVWAVFAFWLVISHVLLVWLRGRVSHDFRIVCKKAVVPLQTPIIIMGGILIGIFTPTEAAAIAVFYAVIIAFFVLKTMTLADLPDVLSRAAMTSAVVLLLVGAAMAFKTVASLSYAPQILAEFILGLSDNPLMLLFLINILLFVVGMFLDAGPAIIILGPILGPIFIELGVHPVHFAIIMCVNLTVGLITPPMGLVLFVASSVSGERVETIAKAILPFLAVEIVVIFLITFFPALSMTIPRLTGFVQ
jgi:tripartite ATP-independent transporter DctM subunit